MPAPEAQEPEMINRGMYEKVYDITDGYTKALGDRLMYSREVFMLGIGHTGDRVDLSGWKKLGDQDYICACYLYLLGRTPIRSEIRFWKGAGRNFRFHLLNLIINSEEFKRRKITLVNVPYQRRIRRDTRARKLVVGLTGTSLYGLYKKMDEEKRMKIRRLFFH